MVDFANEQALTVKEAAVRCRVDPVTIRRWFKRGLAFGKIGGRVLVTLQALNSFQDKSEPQPIVNAIVVDAETLAAIRALRADGFKIGMESNRDDRQNGSGRTKATAEAEVRHVQNADGTDAP